LWSQSKIVLEKKNLQFSREDSECASGGVWAEVQRNLKTAKEEVLQ